ncbi:type II secretion system protein GspC [Alishewanella longhuensis]|uniref:Type II secretion system protein GspC n=1 Tax=Alishewanella longhuensis TaxID=1091037 RepID=A0ABQ3L5G5_9ALTE|nr:type II secretion system protein GspC [Alishewanella longhuensis]GHG75417.1 type II secretion system protein GspC [Alishewanella longhuensis]
MNQTLPLPINQLRQQLLRIPVAFVRGTVNLILVILLAWLLAKFSWQFLPKPESVLPVLPVQATANRSVPQDLTNLTRYPLFGKAEPVVATTPVAVTEAPKTQLNVKLTGLVAVPAKPEAGSAVIEHRGTEATYAVGDMLEGTRAKLHQVLDDRVLLEQNGRFETLMLDGVEFTRIAQANAGLGREDNPELVAAQEPILIAEPIATGFNNPELQAQRDEIMAEPMKFFDYVRVTPVQRDGQLAGYRLMPGKDAAMFQQLGFQQGDLAIEINGVPLNDIQQAGRIINDLRDASEAAIKIERDGEIRDILVSLSQ